MGETIRGDVKLDPPWRQAAEDAAVFGYGDVISFDWLYEHFDIRMPKHGSAEDFKRVNFRFLAAMDGFRAFLLERDNKALANIQGEGYRVVPPGEQTDFAMGQFRKAVRREMRKAAAHLVYIRHDMLTDEESRKNSDARGKLAAFRALTRKQKLLPDDKAD